MLQQFGNIWMDVERIISVGFKMKVDYDINAVGLVDKMETGEVENVTVIFDQGTQLQFDGEEAQMFYDYWQLVNQPVGDIS
jgi:fibronectin type 3 domain-containing protein